MKELLDLADFLEKGEVTKKFAAKRIREWVSTYNTMSLGDKEFTFPKNWPQTSKDECGCPECGLDFKGTFSYCCNRVGCPFGCGPTVC